MAFLALGLTLPGLLLQDSWRFAFFAHGRGALSLINDSVWAIALLAGFVIVRVTGHETVFWAVFAWGAAAAVGAVVGPFQARVRPRLAQTRQWLTTHWDLAPRYLAEGTTNSACDSAGQLRHRPPARAGRGGRGAGSQPAHGPLHGRALRNGPRPVARGGQDPAHITAASAAPLRPGQRRVLRARGGLGYRTSDRAADGARPGAARQLVAADLPAGAALDAVRDGLRDNRRGRPRPARARCCATESPGIDPHLRHLRRVLGGRCRGGGCGRSPYRRRRGDVARGHRLLVGVADRDARVSAHTVAPKTRAGPIRAG